MERVLVGVDGSAAANDALGWATEVARRTGAAVTAVRVFIPSEAELPPEHAAELRDRQRGELETWCADVDPAPEPLLVDGDPPDGLLAAARDQHADLLVVGGRGAGGFTGLHLGSAAHHLAHHTTVPLAIVPRRGPGRSNTSSSASTAPPGASRPSTSPRTWPETWRWT